MKLREPPAWLKSTLLVGGALVLWRVAPQIPISAEVVCVIVLCLMNVAILKRSEAGYFGGDDAAIKIIRALSEGAYNVRASGNAGTNELVQATDALVDRLRKDRIATDESMRLMMGLFNDCGLALIVTDVFGIVVHANDAVQAIFHRSLGNLIGRPIDSLDIGGLAEIKNKATLSSTHGYRTSVRVNKTSVEIAGRRLSCFVFDEVEGLLQVNEKAAFDKLIRVLTHEINNSLAPIVSLSETLLSAAKRESDTPGAMPLAPKDYARGLTIIRRRALAIRSIFDSYTHTSALVKRPLDAVNVAEIVESVADALPYITRDAINRTGIYASAHAVQLEQVLINLSKNGFEASRAPVHISIDEDESSLRIQVTDTGPGLPRSDSLFVPFFTTKPMGSGLGLSVSRDIVVSFGGALTLRRDEARGVTVAELMLRKPSSRSSQEKKEI